MKALVAEAMQDGAVGLSTSLIYPPGAYASTGELIALAATAAEHGGVYFSHMRNESHQVLEAIDEALRIGREAGIPVHIYHLKAAGEENWPLMAGAVEAHPERERRRPGRDRGHLSLHPERDWPRLVPAPEALRARHGPFPRDGLGFPEIRRQLRREVEETSDWENWYRHVGQSWDNVLITRFPDASVVGASLAEAAEAKGVDPWELFFYLVQAGGTGVAPRSMDEEQKRLAMKAPFVCFDNDAAPTNPTKVRSSHPRGSGPSLACSPSTCARKVSSRSRKRSGASRHSQRRF